MGTGKDPSGLGRWCWARFRGRSGITLRIASVYCPCEPNRRADGTILDGELTVYKQHQRFLNESNDDRDPRTAFLQDFETALTSGLEEGTKFWSRATLTITSWMSPLLPSLPIMA